MVYRFVPRTDSLYIATLRRLIIAQTTNAIAVACCPATLRGDNLRQRNYPNGFPGQHQRGDPPGFSGGGLGAVAQRFRQLLRTRVSAIVRTPLPTNHRLRFEIRTKGLSTAMKNGRLLLR